MVLNSCWGGHGSDSLAAALIEAGVEAVVAMQLPLLVSAAPGLTGALYEGLMVGRAFEACLQEYRRGCLRAELDPGIPDWGVPVLYLGVEDSALFRPSQSDPYPVNFRPLIRDYVPIVGRGFLFERIAHWRERGPGGVFLLTAAPGLGKTAFAAQWAADHPEGAHYFFVHREGRSDPDDCLRSLYIALLGRYQVADDRTDPAAQLPAARLRERLRALLADTVGPICAARDLDEVILIDALDESRPAREDHIELAELLPRALPPRVYLLLTARPGPQAERLARRPDVEHLHLEGRDPQNLADVAQYAEHRLAARLPGIEPAALRDAARRIAERTGGNFLVLRYLFSPQSLGGAATLEAIEAAAQRVGDQVADIYRDFYERVVQTEGRQDRKLLNRVLGALATAAAPVTEQQVCAAFGVDAGDWEWALERLAQFLSQGAVREAPAGVHTYGIYHETFQEFLLERLAPDLPGLHARWADLLRGLEAPHRLCPALCPAPSAAPPARGGARPGAGRDPARLWVPGRRTGGGRQRTGRRRRSPRSSWWRTSRRRELRSQTTPARRCGWWAGRWDFSAHVLRRPPRSCRVSSMGACCATSRAAGAGVSQPRSAHRGPVGSRPIRASPQDRPRRGPCCGCCAGTTRAESTTSP